MKLPGGGRGCIVIALFVGLAWLADGTRSSSSRDGSASRVLRALSLSAPLKEPLVLVVFQVLDCADSRARLALWNGREGLRVEGVLVGPLPTDTSTIPALLEASGIRYPVGRSGSRAIEGLLRRLGYEETPVVLAIDAAGRLVEARALRSVEDGAAAEALSKRLLDGHG